LPLQFDFNPLHLQSKNSPAVATFLQLSQDPEFGANSAEVLASSHQEVLAIAKKLSALLQVAQTRTIDNFIPEDQNRKRARHVLLPSLNVAPEAPPTEIENISALRNGAGRLEAVADTGTGPGMSTMGQLLALSLACTLTSAVLFQPALMGEPREPRKKKSRQQPADHPSEQAATPTLGRRILSDEEERAYQNVSRETKPVGRR